MMAVAILDTTVIIHLFRRNEAALSWFDYETRVFAITPITWLEVMVGVPNKRAQVESLDLLQRFEMLHLRPSDMDWAMQQMLDLRFSGGIGVMDCLNASVGFRLGLPIYTHNRKDFLKLLPSDLVVRPY